MAGDNAVLSLLEKMTQRASSAYLAILERWVYECVIDDPYGEFFIAEDKLLQKSSQQDAIKQNEELKKDVNFLRTELQLVRDERDHLLPQVKNLTIEVDNYKEFAGKSSKDLDSISTKTIALEETCASQREQILLLQHQLAASRHMLKRADLATIETMTEYEDQKRIIKDLQDRLADVECKIVEAEKLRKKVA